MELTFDPRYNTDYIRFRDKSDQVETIHISDELNVDISPDGTVYGIELLNANEQLRRGDISGLLVINESTGDKTEIPLSAA